jgi:aryl-alcohol dehydrogenase-like predicted oxidoreductase
METDEAAQVLQAARACGMSTLDTAVAYGESEHRLGELGVREWQVVSKLPGLPESCPDIDGWVQAQVRESLAQLRVPHLHAFLLHRPADLLQPVGRTLWTALEHVRELGLIRKIGISIYAPDELERIMPYYAVELVQSPFNLFDRRLVQSGWARRLAWRGVEIHVRSVFLQGLLLMPQRPSRFAAWEPFLARWDAWRRTQADNGLAACLQFALSVPEVSRVVVGVDSVRQLREIVAAAEAPRPAWPVELWSEDPVLLNPSLWPR